jgi:uncharacterized protein (TIGR02246 family)
MPAFLPEEVDLLFAERFSAGDLEGAIALFESNATFVGEPGKPATGLPAIAEAARAFLALSPKLEIKVEEVVRGADLALMRSHWKLKGKTPDGEDVQMEGRAIEVLRRQSDGTWLYVIDHPYGTGS